MKIIDYRTDPFYDFQSRMTSLTDTNGSVFAYAFDGEGNRVRQGLNDCLTTRFVYDGGNVVMEMNASNEVVWAYVNGAGMDQPVERIAFINGTARNRQVYHADGLGSVSALTDESGMPVQTYAYAAFGGVRAKTGTDLNRVTFTAREALGDSFGFYYYRNRVYDPNTGRFTSEDLMGFLDGPNRYTYAENNSVNYTDAFGFRSEGQTRLRTPDEIMESIARMNIDYRTPEQKLEHQQRLEEWARVREESRLRNELREECSQALSQVLPTPAQVDQLEKTAALIIGGAILVGPAIETGAYIWTSASPYARFAIGNTILRFTTGVGDPLPEPIRAPPPPPPGIERVWPF